MPDTLTNIFTSPNFWGILVPAFAGVITFYKSKAAEREAEWRKEKLKLYLKFIEALSGITDAEKSIEGEKRFAKACNDLHAFSPNSVIRALHKYQSTISISNTTSTAQEKHLALSELVWQMRKDLKIRPLEKKKNLEVLLWTSGTKDISGPLK